MTPHTIIPTMGMMEYTNIEMFRLSTGHNTRCLVSYIGTEALHSEIVKLLLIHSKQLLCPLFYNVTEDSITRESKLHDCTSFNLKRK